MWFIANTGQACSYFAEICFCWIVNDGYFPLGKIYSRTYHAIIEFLHVLQKPNARAAMDSGNEQFYMVLRFRFKMKQLLKNLWLCEVVELSCINT